MSIKEKVQQIIQKAEADKEAASSRAEEERLRLTIEAQGLALQAEILFEKGRTALDSLGIPAVMEDVFNELKKADQEVKFGLRRGKIECWFEAGEQPINLLTKTRFRPRNFPLEVHEAETIGFFVGKNRGGQIVRIGVELEVGDPDKVWVSTARSIQYGLEDVRKNLFLASDPEIVEKIEMSLAKHIFENDHIDTERSYDTNDSYGW